MTSYNNNKTNGASPGTFGVHDQVDESLRVYDKSGAILGKMGVHDQAVEISLNNDNNAKSVSIPGTVGVYDQVVEISLDHDNNNKNGSIPDTVGVHDQVTEVNHRVLEPNGGSYDNNNQNDNNNKMGAIPGTIGVHEQVSEVNHLKEKGNESVLVGMIRLRGEDERLKSLSPKHIKSYQKNGYLVFPDAFTDRKADKLLDEARNLMKRVFEGGKVITRHDIPSGAKDCRPLVSHLGYI